MFEERPRPKPKEKQNKCKIVINKKGDRVEKTIEGNCSPAQLKALSEQSKIEED